MTLDETNKDYNIIEEIKEFKNGNGGDITYSVKELIIALHVKIDKLSNKFEKHKKDMDEKVRNNDKRITINETILGINTLIIVGIIGKLLFF